MANANTILQAYPQFEDNGWRAYNWAFRCKTIPLYISTCTSMPSFYGGHVYRKNLCRYCCYVFRYIRWRQIDREQIRSRINQSTDCRMFRPRRPSSAAYKTEKLQCETGVYIAKAVLYAADKGLRGRNVLQSVDWLILLRICSRSIRLYRTT